MGRLSITTAWNESADFLKRHFGALFTIAVALIAFPNVATQWLAPLPAPPGEDLRTGLWFLLLVAVLLLNMVGSLAISSLALGRENVVGDALRHGLRRLPAMAGASLILIVAALVVALPLILATGIRPEQLTAPTPATAGRLGLVMLVLVTVGLFFAVRLMLLTPVAASEPAGPVAIIARSWALTRGHFWKLLGFAVLITVAAMVVIAVAAMLLGLVIGLAAGPPQEGGLAQLVLLLATSLLNAAFIVIMATMVARIYVQLAGPAAAPASGT
ncbi:MAG TPA: glycerophosphoryl diester phosphodiesterase membrane domain-containing protein [Allosphingosinicella sp.]|jgi:hypothetical protein|nr:glycerophosphoryl diester phosphodiesterase membrane domain-containing protein [Allosphingosinicella sp.]